MMRHRVPTPFTWSALILLALTGCAQLPPEVAAEMSAPDGQRPNHYAIIEKQGDAGTGPEAGSP